MIAESVVAFGLITAAFALIADIADECVSVRRRDKFPYLPPAVAIDDLSLAHNRDALLYCWEKHGANGSYIAKTGSLPEFLCDPDGINPILSPPLSLVATAVQRPMMRAAVRTALYEAGHIILTQPLKGCTALKSWAGGLAPTPYRSKCSTIG